MTHVPHHFSARHRQIMLAIGGGASYREIGTALGISEHTVRAHVIQIAGRIAEFPELPPRWRIFAYVKHHEWEQRHAADVDAAD